MIAVVEPCCAEKVIASLASALVLLEAHEAAPKLLEVLSAWVGPSYRSPLFEVAIALGLLDSDTNTIDGLIAALSSEDPGAQAGSALALGMLKEQRAVDQLVKIFTSDLRRGGERPLTEALYDIPDDLSYNSLKALLISGSSGTKGILSEVAEFALLKSGIPEAVMAVEAAWK